MSNQSVLQSSIQFSCDQLTTSIKHTANIDNMPDSQSAKQYITCNTGENGIWEQTIHRKHLRVYNQKHGECGTQEHTGISPTQHTELNSIREETKHIHIAPNK